MELMQLVGVLRFAQSTNSLRIIQGCVLVIAPMDHLQMQMWEFVLLYAQLLPIFTANL